MWLEKLDIQGFKSFAEPVTLVFTRELTCVVGPNGSGKSNIADAIRWVLGEQSLKLLRGKKHEDVIFAGSDRKNRLGLASVRLSLNNAEHRAKIDYDQLVIERKIERSGESDYVLNNNRVRLLDVQLLLAQAHIGQKSYSIIGQGMIDSLLTYSTAERKEFLDEATGVKQYQIKKNQALHKLEQTEENLKQAELIVQELEPRLRILKRQVRKLERKEEVERELHQLQTAYYSRLLGELQQQLGKSRLQKAKADAELHMLESRQQTIQDKIEATEKTAGRREAFGLLQRQLAQLQAEHHALTKQKVIREGQQDLDLLKSGQAEEVWNKQRLSQLEQERQKIKLRLQTVEAHRARQKAALNRLQKEEADLTARHRTVETKLLAEQHITDWQAANHEAGQMEQEHHRLLTEIDRLDSLQGLQTFKEKLRSLTTRFSQWLQTLRRSWAKDRSSLLQEFRKLSEAADMSQRKVQQEQIAQSQLDKEQELLVQAEQKAAEEIDGLRKLIGGSSDTAKIKDLTDSLAAKERELASQQEKIADFNKAEEEKKQQLVDWQKELRTLQYDYNIKNNDLTNLKVEIARSETKEDDLKKEVSAEFPQFQPAPVSNVNIAETYDRIDQLKKQLHIIGGIDQETQTEFQEVNSKYTFLIQQTADLQQAIKSLIKLIGDLEEKINKQFQDNIKNINPLFGKYFKKLFVGGKASLTLHMAKPEEEEAEAGELAETDELSEPAEKTDRKLKFKSLDYTIEINAMPPGKKLASLSMLSGGEKALTAIALICAIIANNPSPFVLLDEVDAALDEANSIRFAEIIDELSSKTQFITITHNRATMQQAKILYGVTMGDDGISRLLSVNFEQADKMSA